VRGLAVHGFPDEAEPAGALARALGAPLDLVRPHRFPDGELMPVVPEPARTVLVYRSLHHANEKLIELMLAADAWRRTGVERLVLVAPYLCYLRQDAVFAPGEPLSRDVLGRLIGSRFNRLLTVEAHLHRTRDLSAVFGIPARSLSAAAALARAVGGGPGALVVGPDQESAPWAATFADALDGGETLVLEKARVGDRRVRLATADLARVRGRRTVVVDDVVSSGGTLTAVAETLRRAGAASIEAAVAHALFDRAVAARLARAGIERLVSTDSVPHPTNAVALAPLLAEALADEGSR
jgi:ribose-phosphate pyrophosphokinase